MEAIPGDVLAQFGALLDQKRVPVSLHEDYRKWLRYYLDFRMKYPLPDDRSHHVRKFVEKLRSKGQSGKSLHHAAHALSLYFQLAGTSRPSTARNGVSCQMPAMADSDAIQAGTSPPEQARRNKPAHQKGRTISPLSHHQAFRFSGEGRNTMTGGVWIGRNHRNGMRSSTLWQGRSNLAITPEGRSRLTQAGRESSSSS